MSNAYNQLKLDEKSKVLTTINTHKGLFQYNRLCFGVSSAPGIFQRLIENLLKDIPGVISFLDDIVIGGSTPTEHRSRVFSVLTRLQDVGLKLNLSKCSFNTSSIVYLGFHIDEKGLKPTQEKLKALQNAPSPTNLTQLRSYLGMINFYRKFIPNASTLLEPLNLLLRHSNRWDWGPAQKKAFDVSKTTLIDSCLVHYNPKLPIVVVSDSSKYGIGAVMCHEIDGTELPICFASRTLNAAERNYSQMEKEALSLIFAIKKFHIYLWGRSFKLVTDCKPLLGLFTASKPLPDHTSGRLQRWSLMLQSYSFELMHRSGEKLGTADTLSRLPLPYSPESVPVCSEWVNLVGVLDSVPLSVDEVQRLTGEDPILSVVYAYCQDGWPRNIPKELYPFAHRKNELSLQDGCILWGNRIIIPKSGRETMLKELHVGHMGSTKMKKLARSYVWWPCLDKELENLVSSCPECLSVRENPPAAPLHPWEWPKAPWERIHIDYAGPIKNQYFLVIIDAHSKWLEVFPTTTISSNKTIELLSAVFSRFGLPSNIVSDNATCFTSEEFNKFITINKIKLTNSAPYHPSTNGQAENAVKIFKNFLKTCGIFTMFKLNQFLFRYRITPHSTTGVTPSELMIGRKLKSSLDMVTPIPTILETVVRSQNCQKRNHDGPSPRQRPFYRNDSVMVRNYSKREEAKWVPATIIEETGPLSYKCQTDGGEVVRRHTDQIIASRSNDGSSPEKVEEPKGLRRSNRVSKPPERLQVGF
eukprot:TRINITY_DN783_c0_g1_i10.p1 TRINITY_DN783_c0_g1~~TRINITY_DN783_c0_g1_i10.p1  ORF type:complete len:755 (+),score=-63.82 TRINITY_DN783_c0_g1_i10:668-2932(+)